MRYSDANSLGVLIVLLLISFGLSVLVLNVGLDVVNVVVERFEMIRELS